MAQRKGARKANSGTVEPPSVEPDRKPRAGIFTEGDGTFGQGTNTRPRTLVPRVAPLCAVEGVPSLSLRTFVEKDRRAMRKATLRLDWSLTERETDWLSVDDRKSAGPFE